MDYRVFYSIRLLNQSIERFTTTNTPEIKDALRQLGCPEDRIYDTTDEYYITTESILTTTVYFKGSVISDSVIQPTTSSIDVNETKETELQTKIQQTLQSQIDDIDIRQKKIEKQFEHIKVNLDEAIETGNLKWMANCYNNWNSTKGDSRNAYILLIDLLNKIGNLIDPFAWTAMTGSVD